MKTLVRYSLVAGILAICMFIFGAISKCYLLPEDSAIEEVIEETSSQ